MEVPKVYLVILICLSAESVFLQKVSHHDSSARNKGFFSWLEITDVQSRPSTTPDVSPEVSTEPLKPTIEAHGPAFTIDPPRSALIQNNIDAPVATTKKSVADSGYCLRVVDESSKPVLFLEEFYPSVYLGDPYRYGGSTSVNYPTWIPESDLASMNKSVWQIGAFDGSPLVQHQTVCDCGINERRNTTEEIELPDGFVCYGMGHLVYKETLYCQRKYYNQVLVFNLRTREVVNLQPFADAAISGYYYKSGQYSGSIDVTHDGREMWISYGSMSKEGILVLHKVVPENLHIIETFDTPWQRSRFGNTFVINGVLYGLNQNLATTAYINSVYNTHTKLSTTLSSSERIYLDQNP